MTPTAITPAHPHDWRPLLFFNYYRIGLLLLLVTLTTTETLPFPLGSSNPRQFLLYSLIYLLITIAATVTLQLRRPGFYTQLLLLVAVDITMITLLMHFSGGVSSGLGILLVVSIASNSMLVTGQLPPLLAAAATIAILIEQTFTSSISPGSFINYPYAGLTGAAIFTTALLTHALARRVRESEKVVAQQEQDLVNLAQLAEYAVEQMGTGVIAFDGQGKIHIINSAARSIIACGESIPDTTTELPLNLRHYIEVSHQSQPHPDTLHLNDGSSYLATLTPIHHSKTRGSLLFLEDNRSAIRRGQQMKMAAMGRLTAGIAHEIRNPIAAISHAGQLLAESPTLDATELRLTEIIGNNVNRLEEIVTSIMQLGKQQRHPMGEYLLAPRLDELSKELQHHGDHPPQAITFQVQPEDLRICFNPSHLQLILWNLAINGLRHSREEIIPRLSIFGYRDQEERVNIDIIDSGNGVPENLRSQLFEPFFTTDSRGTGLGLYISRELAENNFARLHYRPTTNGESRFSLIVDTPQEQDTTPKFSEKQYSHE
ncbi:MAG: ATPase [Gammaproteobacteria bacterium]|nr:ATPase [Gammaproteobacteria bacterium]